MNLGNVMGIGFSQKPRIPVSVVSDRFNRADNATTLGNAETGQAWQSLSGTWGVIGNQAYLAANGVANKNAVVAESGVSDCMVSAKLSVIKGARMAFRRTDLDNGFIVDRNISNVLLFRQVAGTYTQIATLAKTTADGDVISVTLIGDSIKVSVNGEKLFTVNDSFNQTATKHGIGQFAIADAGRIDDFKVEVI